MSGGRIVYINRIEIDDKSRIVDRQIEVAGYRFTPYLGKRKVKIIPEQNRVKVKSSLIQLLKEISVEKAPIIDFLFWA